MIFHTSIVYYTGTQTEIKTGTNVYFFVLMLNLILFILTQGVYVYSVYLLYPRTPVAHRYKSLVYKAHRSNLEQKSFNMGVISQCADKKYILSEAW